MRSSISGPRCEALPTAPEIFREPVGDLQTKGDGLSVNAVRAANLRRVAIAVRLHIQSFAEDHQGAFDEVRGVADLQSLRGVDNIVRGQAVMQPAGGVRITDGFADSHGESDDVVFYA
jgi:hypothetical protein